MDNQQDHIIGQDAKIYSTQRPFTMVNTAFLFTIGEFTPHEKFIYTLIKAHVNEQQPQHQASAFPSYERLVEISGLSKSTVIKAVSGLVEKKMITKIKTFKKDAMKWKNSYVVHTYEDVHGIAATPEPEAPKEEIPFDEIIDYLNKKTGREGKKAYKADSKATQRAIRARWNKGHRLKEFMYVIDNKVAEWLDNPHMNRHLHPDTLFGPKFDTKYILEEPFVQQQQQQSFKRKPQQKQIFAQPTQKGKEIVELNGVTYNLKNPEEKAKYIELRAMQIGLKGAN